MAVVIFVLFAANGGPDAIAFAQSFDTADIDLSPGTYLADGQPLTCPDGRQRLEDLGFRTVEAMDCGEQSYTYRVSRAGARYEVVVASADGRILRRTSF